MSNEFEKFISENREAFDSRMPDPAILSRIQAQMGGKEQEKQTKKGILIPIRAVRWAAACIVLLAGATIFLLVRKNEPSASQETARVIVIDTPATSPKQEIPSALPVIEQPQQQFVTAAVNTKKKNDSPIDEQMAAQKNALVAKLNDMESPGERITAAEEAYALKNTDKDIVDALVKTMSADPNTNVRLAALEALGRFHREPYVKKQLVASLKTQKDPIVQIELIQLLTKMKQKGILNELEKIVNDGNTMKAVKDHAYVGILTLKS